METWKKPQRAHERRFWATLLCVGAALIAALSSSLLAAAVSADPGVGPGFYLQQSVLLVLTVAGTVLALRRWRAAA